MVVAFKGTVFPAAQPSPDCCSRTFSKPAWFYLHESSARQGRRGRGDGGAGCRRGGGGGGGGEGGASVTPPSVSRFIASPAYQETSRSTQFSAHFLRPGGSGAVAFMCEGNPEGVGVRVDGGIREQRDE